MVERSDVHRTGRRSVSSAVERCIHIADVAGSNPAPTTMAYVYILQSLKNNRYYIGSTTNLTRRLEEHNSGKSPYTRNNRPFALRFQQTYSSIVEAQNIESWLKKLKNRKILEKIIQEEVIKKAL